MTDKRFEEFIIQMDDYTTGFSTTFVDDWMKRILIRIEFTDEQIVVLKLRYL
jgi:hypothetical protein